MIGPQIGRTAFRIAFAMVAVSTIMIFVLAPGSAEYWISVFTLISGLVFVGIVIILVRVMG